MNILQTLMKCVYTAGSIRTESIESVNLDRPEIRFKACNVNEDGEEISRGEIQLTNSHLTFYRPGMFPIRWEISCIRRYGCDDNLLSFESGRKGPFGAGIYAFKVDRGVDLINMLRENILKAGLNEQETQIHLESNLTTDDRHHNFRPLNEVNQKINDNIQGAQCNSDDQKLNAIRKQFFHATNKLKSDTNQDKSPCNYTKDACTSTDSVTVNDVTTKPSTSKIDSSDIPPQPKEEDTQLSYTMIDFASTKALEATAASHDIQRH